MASGPGEKPPTDLQAIALDWITIWQSELLAMATDRELQDAWTRLVTLWAQSAERAAGLLPNSFHDSPAGQTGAVSPPRSPAPVAAPDARDAAIQRLEDRVARLERRIGAASNGRNIRRT